MCYLDYYRHFRRTQIAAETGRLRPDQVNTQELAALFSIRQWNEGSDPNFSPIRKIASTLVEIGIDYFNQVPGALNRQSSLGQALEHFLNAFDRIPFADKQKLHRHAELIVPELFIAAAEAISSLSDELTSDPKIQDFIQAAGQGIAQDLVLQIEQMSTGDIAARREAVVWGKILLRSAVSNAGYYIVDGPVRLFDLNAGGQALIQQTGGVLLEAILEKPNGIDLGAGLSRAVLDRLMQTAFGVIAQHPSLLARDIGLKQVVEGVSGALAQTSFQDRPDYLPEIARLILEHTAINLEFVLQANGSSSQQILVETARQTLFILSETNDGRWQPQLGKDQLLRIIEYTISLTAENPNWLLAEFQNDSLIYSAIRIILEVIREMPEEERFSSETIVILIETVLDGLVGHESILGLVKWADGETEETVLKQALKLVLYPLTRPMKRLGATELFERRLARRQRVIELLEFAIDRILRPYPDRRGIQLLALLSQQYLEWHREHPLRHAVAEDMLDLGLQILIAHPDKLLGPDHLSALGKQLFIAIEAMDMQRLKGYEVLPDLFRLCLRVTAAHAHLVMATPDRDEPRYLAVVFLSHALPAIAGKDESGAWCPEMSVTQLLSMLEHLLDVLVSEPEWLIELSEDDPIQRQIIQAVMDSLAKLPDGARIRSETLELLLWSAMRAGLTSPILVQPDDQLGQRLISRMLDIIISFVYAPNAGAERTAILDYMLRFTAEELLVKHPNKRGIALLHLILAGYDYEHDRPLDTTQLYRLMQVGLEIIERHPYLIEDEQVWQDFLSELAGSLAASTTDIDHLLPEILRLSLQVAGRHIDRLLTVGQDDPRRILTLAIEQTLLVVTRPPADGQWRPQLAGEDLLGILTITLEAVVANPQWVKDELLRRVLEVIWTSISEQTPSASLSHEILMQLVEATLQSVNLRKSLTIPIVDAQGQDHEMVLELAFDRLLLTIYDPNGNDIAQWTLQQDQVILAIAEAYLYRLSQGPANEILIQALNDRIRQAANQLAQEAVWNLEALIGELEQLAIA
ncbi:MAG: hypothetical protein AAGF87_17745 [Bacteroidota bacterium]